MKGKISISIPALTKEPDANGRIYSVEAVKKAVKNFVAMPIVDRGCANIISGIDNYTMPNSTVIGIIDKAKFKKRKDIIILKGKLINTELNYIINPDTGELEFIDVSLLPFGK